MHQYNAGTIASIASPLPDPNIRIAAIGGGTGLSNLLQGLKHKCFPVNKTILSAQEKEKLTAIVTVSDDGGSSSILRKAYSIMSPGDIRNCLLALSNDRVTMKNLFDFRFNQEIDEHSLGNLILTALSQIESDFLKAIDTASEILDIQGTVLPATTDNIAIRAEFDDGTSICGESGITAAGKRIKTISLLPVTRINTLPKVTEVLTEADVIILGPGSLYTSIIPPLLVPGTADAIANSNAKVIMVMNLMTESGETDHYRPADFLAALRHHVPQIHVHVVLINSAEIPANLVVRNQLYGATPIPLDTDNFEDFKSEPVFRDLIGNQNHICHDPEKLSDAIIELAMSPLNQ